jgi:hypothetical protein
LLIARTLLGSTPRRSSMPALLDLSLLGDAPEAARSPASCPAMSAGLPVPDLVGASNKPPILPYRGALHRVCFAIELMIDACARDRLRAV